MVEFRKGPPKERDVARPVANLGNTCYMNAVLQALAHAPELCMAMDVDPHYIHCPIFLENAQKRRSSPSSSPEHVVDIKISGTRKSKRSSGKKSPTASTNNDQEDWKFCALCEVEQHLLRVHSNDRDKPVAPSAFVNGFINQVAPWFKLGQQEDSHEFLRILIDAMQRSCKQARTSPENPQDTPPEKTGDEDDEEEQATKDVEYPFQLFRGMVESNVTCGSCRSTSSTRDPIEDIGLDVTPVSTSSSSSSPTPGSLADVSTALQRFARAEALDSGYKCEKCGKVGRATKQSRLASIPPILTLHLKRFRYGETQAPVISTAGQRRSNRSSEVSQLMNSDFFGGKSGSAKIEGHSKFEQILDLKPYLTEEMQAKHSKVFCRLFAVVVHAGKNSHSGHYVSYVRNISKNEWWKMDDARITLASVSEVMNAEAYMLFYRVVEHPFAVKLRQQERELVQEWSKDHDMVAASSTTTTTGPSTDVPSLDNSGNNVERVKVEDDLHQEFSQDHSSSSQAKVASGGVDLKDSTTESSSIMVRPDISPKMEDMGSIATSSVMSSVRPSSNSNNNQNNISTNTSNHNNSRKRKAPEYTNGEDWARAKTTLPDTIMSKFREVETIISEYVQFKPEFFKFLADQASRRNAKVGHGPSSGICEDDVKDGTSRIKRALLEVFYELDKACVEGGGSLFRKRINTLRDKGMMDQAPLEKQQQSQLSQQQTLGVLVSSLVDPDEDPLL
mmetsp:Transcript_1565/g.4678  ORF Transcript_1565/g.4678 Transcript_1565/m.4678 type:complete len:730 (-) Transcript_1565:352-2541(-)